MPAAKPASPLLRRDHRLVSGLVGGYPMHEGSGLALADLSGRGNTGTFQGGVIWTKGQSGYCLSFNGTSGYVSCATNSGLPPLNGLAYSITMWVNGSANQVDKRVWSDGSSTTTNPILAIGTTATGTDAKSRVLVRNDAATQLLLVTTTGNVFDGTWHHICWTDAAGAATYYIDGQPDASNFNYTRSGTFTLNRSTIGCVLRTTTQFFFSGLIDGVLAYNRVLADNEVLALYQDQWQMFRRRQQFLAISTVEPPPTVTAWPAAILGHL